MDTYLTYTGESMCGKGGSGEVLLKIPGGQNYLGLGPGAGGRIWTISCRVSMRQARKNRSN